eukprot:m.10779 g.10779  ORF g.10779 m.10779 type:complete len:150 (-) comp6227_c0_seq1:176-625(-)
MGLTVIEGVISGLHLSIWISVLLNTAGLISFADVFAFRILLCLQVTLESIVVIVLFFLTFETVEWKRGKQRSQLRKLLGALLAWFIELFFLIWVIVQSFEISSSYAVWSRASQILFSFQRIVWAPIFWCLFHRSLKKISGESRFLPAQQ